MADKKVVIKVKGMTCGQCVQAVEKALLEVQGVNEAKVDLAGERAAVQFDDERADEERLKKAVIEAGYSAI